LTGDQRWRVLRLLLWLIGLLAVAAQLVIANHKVCLRGTPSGQHSHGGRFPAPVAEADVPILGVNVSLEQYDDAGLETALTHIDVGGFTWVRQSFFWSQIEPEMGRFDWKASDRVLNALAHHPQLRLVAVLEDDPPIPPAHRTGNDHFAAFAHEFATRYGAQVDYYQIWDEPNLADHWGGGPVNPVAYADLLARVAPAIRAADPDARILLAGLAPTVETGPQNLSDERYLNQLYQAGAAPYFDIVAGKPYGFYTGPDDRRVDAAVLNFSRLILLREVMVRHGDADKALWASHWGWNALPTDWAGRPSLWGQTDDRTQAARTLAALDRARAEWPWAGALILEHFQPSAPPDDPRWGFALVGPEFRPRPVYDAVAGWAAALPQGASPGGHPALSPWATYEGDWHVGALGADIGSDGDRVTFRFAGSAIALTVRRGPYRAFLYVTVDGEPANQLPLDGQGRAYVVLYDSSPTEATVPLATGLAPGPHTVEVVAEGGQGQWALVDWRVSSPPAHDGGDWKMTNGCFLSTRCRPNLLWTSPNLLRTLSTLAVAALMLALLSIHDARRVAWTEMAQTLLTQPEWAQGMLAAGLTGLLWITAGASWGNSLSFSARPLFLALCFSLSLLTLPALALLFALRPDLGLTLVALTAPFYLHPGGMLDRALSLPEVLVILTGVGTLVRTRMRPIRAHGRQAAGQLALLTPLDRCVALLVMAALVAGVAASDWQAALFELRTVFLLPALYYALLRLTPLDRPATWRIVDGLVLGGVGVAAIGLGQYVMGHNVVPAEGGLSRLQSVYYSPNNVGLYLERVWPLLVAVALWKRRSRFASLIFGRSRFCFRVNEVHTISGRGGSRLVLYRLALAPVTLALVLSFSRGALLLGLPAAALVMGWWASKNRRYRWFAMTSIALALVIGALTLIPLLRLPRFASLLDLERGSTFFRLKLWRSSLTLIREHPWLGVGPGNFLGAYRTRYVLPSAWEEFNLEHPHNIYLDHWARLGLLGLLAGTAVQIAFWRALSKPLTSLGRMRITDIRRKDWGILLGLAGSMAAVLAHGLVDNTIFFPDLSLTFFLTLALAQQGDKGA
jgi:O-antigen ligase